MKKIKSLIKTIFILTLSVIILAQPISVSAATSSGKCGENVTWSFNSSTGTLTISGTGAMENYDAYPNYPAYHSHRESIKTITISSGVTTIGDCAFYSYKSVTSISIPRTVKSIGKNALFLCEGLTSISVVSSNQYYSSQDGVLFNKDKTELIHYPIGKAKTSYVIPNSVLNIGDHAFYASDNLTSVSIPNGVTGIDKFAFGFCYRLKSITIPSSVSSIGDDAFYHCEGLTSTSIPSSVTSIGDGAFGSCYSLKGITIPNSITSIGSNTFSYCINLTSITIPSNVTSIGIFAFDGCKNLTSITIPSSVTSIGGCAFRSCNALKNVYYGGTVSKWNAISIDSYNECLTNANIYYNHYKHSYKTTITKATTSKNGKKVQKCSKCGTSKTTTIYYPKTIKLSATVYTYNGNVKKPSVTVKDSKGNKIAASNYTVSYSSGCKDVGQYTVTVKFKGNYSGTVKRTFTIRPKGTDFTKYNITEKGRLGLEWKKGSGITGYQIQISKSSNFSKNTTTINIKNKNTVKSGGKVSRKTIYYCRIRTYKTVKVNGKSKNIYSSWSKTKSVKTA